MSTSNQIIYRSYWPADSSIVLLRRKLLKPLINEKDEKRLTSDVVTVIVYNRLFINMVTAFYCRRCFKRMGHELGVHFNLDDSKSIKMIANEKITHPPHPSRFIPPKVAALQPVLFKQENAFYICSCTFKKCLINIEKIDFNTDGLDFCNEQVSYTGIIC